MSTEPGVVSATIELDLRQPPSALGLMELSKTFARAGYMQLAHYLRGCGEVLLSRPSPQECAGRALTPGVQLIAAERQRQIEAEGWSPEHDDQYIGHDLASAAICYADPFWSGIRNIRPDNPTPRLWPWKKKWWKPDDGSRAGRIRSLVKAGALLAAEIERLQRSANFAPPSAADDE